MPDLHAMVPGSMPMGWLKKISALEEQNRQRQREIQALVERVKGLENSFRAIPETVSSIPVTQVLAELPVSAPAPIKRGPGRPRKSPQ